MDSFIQGPVGTPVWMESDMNEVNGEGEKSPGCGFRLDCEGPHAPQSRNLGLTEQVGGGLEGRGAEREVEGFRKEDPGSSWQNVEGLKATDSILCSE